MSDLGAVSCLSRGFMILSSAEPQHFTIPGLTDPPSPAACGLWLFVSVWGCPLVIRNTVLSVSTLSLMIFLVNISPGAPWVCSLYVSAWRTFRIGKIRDAIF